MSRIAIIPARGGSKRIPRKNIKLFLGKPIIAYSIESALASNLFDEVMVSTDDEEIASIAKEYGARVPFYRSTESATDYATTVDVLLEVLSQYSSQGKHFDFGCCVYPSAPFSSQELLLQGYNKLIDEAHDFVFPAQAYGHPIQRSFSINPNNDNRVELFSKSEEFTRTQDLKTYYHDAGQFYWFNSQSLLINKSLMKGKIGILKVSPFEAHDIDEPLDWKMAEFKYKLLKQL
jgi:pseudaminic acid cytidylyltransferase